MIKAEIRTFCAVHPAEGLASKLAALPYDVYSRDEAREQVKKAVIKYINDSQLAVLQLNPIYEMFAPTMDDRFYAFSWDEVQMQINKWNNENRGLKG